MDTSVEDLAKAVRDPLRSQCPKFGDDTSKSNTIILTEKVDTNNSALNVFLVHVFVRFARQELHTTGNDRYSGDRHSGIDRFSGTKTSDDDAILFTANDYFSGNDRYSGTKNPDRFFHYNGRCLYI